jgi:hypothetical protein
VTDVDEPHVEAQKLVAAVNASRVEVRAAKEASFAKYEQPVGPLRG